MKIFKFGGASVKDSFGVRNILNVLKNTGFKNTFIVVSAMGKTTNALEQVVRCYFEDKNQLFSELASVRSWHYEIIDDLFKNNKKEVTKKVNEFFDSVINFLNKNRIEDYSFVYDQVVSLGELVSTTIISHYHGT